VEPLPALDPLRAWQVVDAEELAILHPDVCEIPDAIERMSLSAGTHVVLVLESGQFVERLWVEVSNTTPAGYIGTVASIPAAIDLEWGGPIAFEPRHVADIAEIDQ
jgi:hypothetical protein